MKKKSIQIWNTGGFFFFFHENRTNRKRHVIKVATKYMKRCSTLYIIRELQIKTTVRYYYTPIRMAKKKRMAKIQNTTVPNAGEDVEQRELSFIAGGNAKWCSHFGRQFGGFLQNVFLLYNPVIVLLSIYSKELKTYVQKLAHGCLQQLCS